MQTARRPPALAGPGRLRLLLAFASTHAAWLLAVAAGAVVALAAVEIAALGAPLLLLLALLLVAATLLLPAALLGLSYLADERASPQAPLRMRPLAFTEPARWARRQRELGRPRPPPAPLHPSKAVSEAADGLIALVLRDFVSAWHTPLSLGGAPPGEAPPSDFPQAIEAAIRASLARTLERTADVDVATLGVRRLLPIVTAHMAAHRRATAQLRGAASELSPANSTAEDDVFLARAYNDGVLHPAVGAIASADTRHSERAHLRALVERALRAVMPSRESASPAVWTVTRELVACTILLPVIDALSEPDTLNALLDQKAGAAIQEQKLIGRLRDALDQEQTALPSRGHVSGTSSPWHNILGKSAAKSGRQTDKKTRSFASFLASIDTMNVFDARRTRSDLVQQIRKTQSLLDNATPATAQQAALRRLQTAVLTVDARLALLGADQGDDASDKLAAAATGLAVPPSSVQLRDVLRSPSAISHFLEWMERKQRGMLPQFWLSVDMFKGPLEDVESGSEDEGDATAGGDASPREVQALREDLRLFADHYFGSEQLSISQRHVAVVRRFLDTSPESPTSRRAVHVLRQSVLKAQREIEDEMLEDDWPAFRQSAGFFSAVDDLAREKQAVVGSPAPASPDEAAFPEPPAGTPRIRSRAALAAVIGSASPLSAASGRSALFGEAEDGTQSPRMRSSGQLRAPAMTQKLDLLIGGAGTTRGSSGRAPLFQEALFGEDDAASEDELVEESASETLRADRMDALQHALSSIIDEDGQHTLDPARQRVAAGSRPVRPLSVASTDSGARSPVPGPSRKVSEATVASKARFATAKRDLRPAFKRSGTSAGDEEHSHRRLAVFGDDAQESPSQAPEADAGEGDAPVRALPAPPSLDYGAELARVDTEIARLNGQLELLDALVRKAELTGASAKETRLLQKSHSTVARELREQRWERTQIAERDAQSALLPGRTEVSIAQTSVGHEQDGKDYVLYIIEVTRLSADEPGEDGESRVQSGHAVSRRYAEFHALHVRLRERLPEVRALEHLFPGKRLMGLVHAPFVDSRRQSLNRYLKALVRVPGACASPELRIFLSATQATVPSSLLDAAAASARPHTTDDAPAASHGFVRSLFRSVSGVAEGIDDLIFGPSMLEVIATRLSSGASLIGAAPDLASLTAAMEPNASAAELKEAAAAGRTPFTEPLCALLFELFELREKDHWLRRQSLVIVLQQALGGTIERKLREGVQAALSASAIVAHLATLRNLMWPDGKLKPASVPRTPAQKAALRESAHTKMSTIVPDVAASFIGRENARRGARRTWALLQNKRLNKHLIYTLLDAAFDEAFGGL